MTKGASNVGSGLKKLPQGAINMATGAAMTAGSYIPSLAALTGVGYGMKAAKDTLLYKMYK